MRKKRMKRLLSTVLSLCMLTGTAALAGSANAVTADSESVGVSSTAAGSLVEDDGFTWDNATVYFLLTDRFRNGDTSNDHSYGRALDASGNAISGWDTNPGTFHGGDFVGITQSIEEGYFDNLGINALWISAPYEQIHGYCASGNGFAHYSYHGYYVLDYTETDANFGTAEEFEEMVDTAHEHGIRVIMDIVMNHAGYNTVADMETYGFGTLLDGASEYKYKITDTDDVNDYIDFTSSASDWGNWWGNDWVRSGLPGYDESGTGDSNFITSLNGLPDFRTEQTTSVSIPNLLKTKWTQEGTYSEKLAKYGSSNTVTGYLTSWLSEWVREYGVDGFRCDTAKHVEKASWNALKTACVSALDEWRENNPDKAGADWEEDFWMTGECWDHGVGYDTYYTEGGFDSMINFSTNGAGVLASGSVANTYQSYADQINSTEGFNVLSFISSHDEQLTRGSEATMIYNGSALLLCPGGVQIFYGDETNRQLVSGMSFDGNGGAGHSLRSDMNWDSINETVLAHWQKVGLFRNKHVSVGAGDNTKLSATNGVAFGRTYDKNGVTDKTAAVIGCTSNTSVTIDVAAIWDDGDYVINAYDNSSCVVSSGKVTFNSGANGTILMEDADGQPLVSLTGDAQFYGNETLTVSLVDCDSAKVSIDGGNKFTVTDGDTFSIGSTAYANDTITVKVEAENEKTTTEAEFSFVKLGETGEEPTTAEEDPTSTTVTVSQTSTITINSSAGTPYVYAWTGSSNTISDAWPGTAATQVSSGVYEITLDVAADTSFNVVLNNGSGTQSGDLTGLYDGAVLNVPSGGFASASITSSGTKQSGGSGDDDEPYDGSVTITIVPYSSSSTYYIYAWDDDETALAGTWPGTQLTEKDDDGNYVVTYDGYEQVNVIVNMGSGSGQTADITGVKDGATIEITNSGCTEYKMTEKEVVLSTFEQLKKEAREILAMTSSDYTSSSWSTAQSALATADAIIKAGDGATDEETMQSALDALTAAQAALVLAQPTLTYAVAGQTTITGIAVSDSTVTVTVDGTAYTAQADDVTGEFTVTGVTLKSTSTIKIVVERNDLSSSAYTYKMSSGDVNTGETPTSPTAPTATETSATSTTATKATSTTSSSSSKLTVNATSNYFGSASKTYNSDGDQVTVTYKLDSNFSVVNSQWTLTYDTSKLSFNSASMPAVDGYVNNYDNVVAGVFTDAEAPVAFDGDTFATVTFDIIGTGTADVYLDVEILTIGKLSGSTLNRVCVVDDSTVCDLSSNSTFKSASLTATTTLDDDILMGDVNLDGSVTISDVTLLQRYVARLVSFTATQLAAADTDGDGRICVKDATAIQKYIVGMISSLG